ncbi:MAG: sodium:proton antiporter, partial [Planctomycetota bacterium]
MNPFFSLAAIVVFGIGAQWLSWRLHLPAILLLLFAGFLCGPVLQLVVPQKLLRGDLLHAFVSLSVALILFEGGLSLKLSELREVGRVVRNLISLGVLVTWLVATGAAHWILGLPLWLAILFGALLTVTGPTVVLPLLRHIRPSGATGSILKWEGIIVDPVGAMLAVLVFETIKTPMVGALGQATAETVIGSLRTVFFGTAVGVAGAGVLVFLLKHYWIPDFLHNPVTLMIVFMVFAGANLLQAESGLFGVTFMGIFMANQKSVNVRHIVEFKENLRVLLISALFILLGASLKMDDLHHFNWASLGFLAVLILVARPLSVLLSAAGSGLTWRERLFLALMAPRGIVAAAVASLFALELTKEGFEEASLLVPLTFVVIIGTVAFYGLAAGPIARRLGLSQPQPQGILFAGAHSWARELAQGLHEQGFRVVLVDNNWENISAARMAGLPTYYCSILAEAIE